MIAMPTKYFLSPREMKKENIRCAGGMKKKEFLSFIFHLKTTMKDHHRL